MERIRDYMNQTVLESLGMMFEWICVNGEPWTGQQATL